MKKIYLSFFLAIGIFNLLGQNQINLTFIGKDSLTQNLISLDSVYVNNLTESCDTLLYGPVAVLSFVANWPVGINETNANISGSFILNQNYPNPFQGSTVVNIFREYSGPLKMLLFDGLGKKLAEYKSELDKGLNSFVVSSSGNRVLMLTVVDDKNIRSIKIVSVGQENLNSNIRYLGNTQIEEKNSLKNSDNSGFIFYLGNQLLYTAYANGYYNKSITDSPSANATYTFLMAPAGVSPTVITTQVTNITQTSATSGGNVTSDGGYPVITRGVCWSTLPNPTIANSYTIDGNGLGMFVSYLVGLAPGTTYYIRAFATNGIGTGYGNEFSFITLQNITLPTVTTAAITNVTQTTATSGGNVTSDGGASVTTRGVCWSTSPNPTIANSHTTDGSGLGSYISYLTGLSPNTLYYVCAYATNSAGTAYGNENSFTTGQTITPPTVTTTPVTNITLTTATSGGNVTSDGGATVTARGVCWSSNPNPVITGNHTTNGSGTGTFVSNITGLTGGTLYYIRAYATNSIGTSYGNELSFTTLTLPTVTTNVVTNILQTSATSGGNVTSDGGSMVTARGVCWSTIPNPIATGNHTTDGTGLGSFVSNITGLIGGTLYYVRAYATSSVGTSYGNEVTFTTLGLPTVTTANITNISQNTATSGGNVISEGGISVTARGVCWGTTSNPTIYGTHTTDGSGPGAFVSNLTGLTPNILYYVRAYATNSIGTSYGNQVNFTTGEPCPGISSVSYEGKTYNTVQIGNRCWFKENLNVGTFILNTGSQSQTNNGIKEKYCYNNLESNCNIYGGLYQWNEMMQYSTTLGAQGLCPNGWHIPTDGEWTNLFNYLGGASIAGGKMKEIGTTHWISPNTDATNESGFTALPAGSSGAGGIFVSQTTFNGLMSSWAVSSNAWYSYLTANSGSVNNVYVPVTSGYSVRCIKNDTTSNAIIITTPVTNITGTTATSGGNVTNSGGSTVTARGVCWGTSVNPTIYGNHSIDGSGTGTFISQMTGLPPNSLSYVRAYATNATGTFYGKNISFWTLYDIPTVTTTPVTNITQTTATSGGNVTSNGGGASITARGVCWSTTTMPTIANSHTSDGPGGLGSFISNVIGLAPNTLYYLRAYATNNAGTGYGNEYTFTTLTAGACGAPVNYEGKTYNTILIGYQCWFKENLNVGTRINGTLNQANNGIKEKYCQNDIEANCDIYGGMYQWSEMMQYTTAQGAQGLCPPGWYLPTDADWTALTTFLGGESIAGGKMKETGTVHWISPNTGATNSSGFTALPGGTRFDNTSPFFGLGYGGNFWSSTENSPTAWYRALSNSNANASRSSCDKTFGFSVRCLHY